MYVALYLFVNPTLIHGRLVLSLRMIAAVFVFLHTPLKHVQEICTCNTVFSSIYASLNY